MVVILKLTYNPNLNNLYTRIKETPRGKMKWDGNFFDITDEDYYSEMNLIEDIRKLYNPI